jgi:hypothetical protein
VGAGAARLASESNREALERKSADLSLKPQTTTIHGGIEELEAEAGGGGAYASAVIY